SLYTVILISASLLSYIFCFLAVLVVIDEDTDRWNGVIAEGLFKSDKFIKDPWVLIVLTAFFLLFLPLFVLQWDEQYNDCFIITSIVRRGGRGTRHFNQYLLALAYEIPFVGRCIPLLFDKSTMQFSDSPGSILKTLVEFLTATYIF